MSNGASNSRGTSVTSDEAFDYEVDDTETVTEAIVTAVTAVTGDAPAPSVATGDGTVPLDLPPLYTVIDPDALESLFQPTSHGGRTTGRVQFHYAGCEISIRDDGHIVVRRNLENAT